MQKAIGISAWVLNSYQFKSMAERGRNREGMTLRSKYSAIVTY